MAVGNAMPFWRGATSARGCEACARHSHATLHGRKLEAISCELRDTGDTYTSRMVAEPALPELPTPDPSSRQKIPHGDIDKTPTSQDARQDEHH